MEDTIRFTKSLETLGSILYKKDADYYQCEIETSGLPIVILMPVSFVNQETKTFKALNTIELQKHTAVMKREGKKEDFNLSVSRVKNGV